MLIWHVTFIQDIVSAMSTSYLYTNAFLQYPMNYGESISTSRYPVYVTASGSTMDFALPGSKAAAMAPEIVHVERYSCQPSNAKDFVLPTSKAARLPPSVCMIKSDVASPISNVEDNSCANIPDVVLHTTMHKATPHITTTKLCVQTTLPDAMSSTTPHRTKPDIVSHQNMSSLIPFTNLQTSSAVRDSPGFICKTCSKHFAEFEALVFHMFHAHVTDSRMPATYGNTKHRIRPYPLRTRGTSMHCNSCNIHMPSGRALRRHTKKIHNICV